MIEVSLRDAKEIVKMGLKENLSVVLLGSPGIGKDACIKTVAKEEGYGLIPIDCTSKTPKDVNGYLIPKGSESFFTTSPFMPKLEKDGEKGILLFSDITQNPSILFQTALRPATHPDDRRLGSYKLPVGWLPMFTGNYTTDGSGAQRLLEHFKDTCIIVNVNLPFQHWKEDFAIPSRIHPHVIGLLNFKKDLFNTFKNRDKLANSKSFASARSHTMVSSVLYYHDRYRLSDNALLGALSGLVGEGVAIEYLGYIRNYESLNGTYSPELIIDGGKNPKPPKEDVSLLYAICTTIPYYLEKSKLGIQKAVDRMLEYSQELEAEFAGLMLRDAFSMYRENILKSPLYPKVAERLV